MQDKLVVENLTKKYGQKTVLDDITLTFEKGRIYSVIGVNGAGKTTFFNCVDGDIVFDSGSICLDDGQNGKKEIGFDDVGLVSDSPLLPDFLTGYEYINYFSNLHNTDKTKSIDDYFEIVRINEEDRHKLIKEYSFGMKNKLQLLACLIRKPRIILLDEPLSSFDIVVSHEIKELLISMKKDHIIIMSTHIMQLAQDVSDEIVLLRDGKMKLLSELDIHSADFEQYIIEKLSEGKRA